MPHGRELPDGLEPADHAGSDAVVQPVGELHILFADGIEDSAERLANGNSSALDTVGKRAGPTVQPDRRTEVVEQLVQLRPEPGRTFEIVLGVGLFDLAMQLVDAFAVRAQRLEIVHVVADRRVELAHEVGRGHVGPRSFEQLAQPLHTHGIGDLDDVVTVGEAPDGTRSDDLAVGHRHGLQPLERVVPQARGSLDQTEPVQGVGCRIDECPPSADIAGHCPLDERAPQVSLADRDHHPIPESMVLLDGLLEVMHREVHVSEGSRRDAERTLGRAQADHCDRAHDGQVPDRARATSTRPLLS